MVEAGATYTREEVWFRSGTERCAAWLFRPTPSREPLLPCIVMGHGFGAVRDALVPHAERFVRAGYAVLAFDYRSFGASEGEPRQVLDIEGQHADWRAAIAHTRALPGIDPARIVLWGSSFGGGHVMAIAAEDPKLAAVIAQVPYTSGIAATRSAAPLMQLKLAREAALDLLGARRGQAPRYVPLVGRGNELAAMTTDGAVEFFERTRGFAPSMRNEVAARVFMQVPAYSPGRKTSRVRCPLLVLVAERDRLTPAEPAIRAAQRAPIAEVRRYPVDHFDVYFGEWFERAIGDTLDFLERHVPLAVHRTGEVPSRRPPAPPA